MDGRKAREKVSADVSGLYTPQVPRIREAVFPGVDRRYTEYAKILEGNLGIPYDIITPLIFILIRACVHYALFEDEFYLQAQIKVLKGSIEFVYRKTSIQYRGKRTMKLTIPFELEQKRIQ